MQKKILQLSIGGQNNHNFNMVNIGQKIHDALTGHQIDKRTIAKAMNFLFESNIEKDQFYPLIHDVLAKNLRSSKKSTKLLSEKVTVKRRAYILEQFVQGFKNNQFNNNVKLEQIYEMLSFYFDGKQAYIKISYENNRYAPENQILLEGPVEGAWPEGIRFKYGDIIKLFISWNEIENNSLGWFLENTFLTAQNQDENAKYVNFFLGLIGATNSIDDYKGVTPQTFAKIKNMQVTFSNGPRSFESLFATSEE